MSAFSPATDSGVLEAHEAPAVDIIRQDRQRPVLLVCDHASNAVPASLASLGLDPEILERHVGWDIGAADVTRHLSRLLSAPAVLTGYSRLVIDCNREPGTASSIPEVSDGIEIPGNRNIGVPQQTSREQAFFEPYQAAVAALVRELSDQNAVPAIISIHSFTPVMAGFARPWHVGLLWDRDPRLSAPLSIALSSEPGIVVGDNEPYSARDPEGLTLRRHAEAAGLPHILIELRQDLIDSPAGAAAWATRLATALHPILAQPSLYRAEPF